MQRMDGWPTRASVWLGSLALLLAAALRFGGLGREPLWADETLTARAAGLGLIEILTDASSWEHNPPLFGSIMHGWVALAGTSESALRVPAAVFGLLTVWVVFRIASRLGGAAYSWVSLALAVGWPILVVYSQEARTYSLFALTTTVAYDRLLRVLDDGAARRHALQYALAVALCLYSHNQAMFIIATHAVTAMGVSRLNGKGLPPGRWWAGLASGVACFLPWMPTLLRQARDIASWQEWWLPTPAPVHLIWMFYSSVTHVPDYPLAAAGASWVPVGPSAGWVTVGLTVLVASLCVLGVARRRVVGLRAGGAAVLLLWWLAPQGLAYAASHVSTPVFLPRFQLASVPALCLLTALGVCGLGPSRVRMAGMVGVLIAGQTVGLAYYYSTPSKEQWNEVARILSETGRRGDVVVLSAPFIRTPFSHYYRGDLGIIELSDWDEPPRIAHHLREVLPSFRRVWFVEAYSGRHSARSAFDSLFSRGPASAYAVRGIALSRYDLVEDPPGF